MNDLITLPQSRDIERAVLGAMLIDKGAIESAIEIIKAETFFSPVHQTIYRAILKLYVNGIGVDQLTISEGLSKEGNLDAVGGESTIADLMTETASAANIKEHCNIINTKHLLRKIMILAETAYNQCSTMNVEPIDIIGNIQNQLLTITDNVTEDRCEQITSVLDDAYDYIKERYDKGEITGVPSGFKRLDNRTDGWQPGELIILGGLTSLGKSVFAMDLAMNAAKEGRPAIVFSLEMSKRQLGVRTLANISEKELTSIRYITLDSNDWEKISEKKNNTHGIPLYIDDSARLSLDRLLIKIKKGIREKGIKLVIIDYLTLLKGHTSESRRLEVESISRSLKQYAKETEIPIIALSQFSRKANDRSEGAELSDLRESGSIEQDADVVIYVHKPSDCKKLPIDTEEPDLENIRELQIKKLRNGKTGSIYVFWYGKYQKFEDLEYKTKKENK